VLAQLRTQGAALWGAISTRSILLPTIFCFLWNATPRWGAGGRLRSCPPRPGAAGPSAAACRRRRLLLPLLPLLRLLLLARDKARPGRTRPFLGQRAGATVGEPSARSTRAQPPPASRSSETAMFYYQTNALHFTPEFLGRVRLAGSLASLAGVGGLLDDRPQPPRRLGWQPPCPQRLPLSSRWQTAQ
jgi:hypothetical protein